MTAFLTSSCAGSPQTATNYTVSAVFYSKAIAYFQDMISGMQDEAKTVGITLDISYANFDVTEQYNLLQNAITKRPSGIILAPLNPEAFAPGVKQAKAAGIPLITVGDDVAADARSSELAFVGPSFEEMGAMKARYVVEKLTGPAKIVVIHGPRGIDFVEGMKRGYQQVFAKEPRLTIVEGPYGNISSDVGLKSTQDMLAAHPDVKALMFDSEDLALGGIKAVQERGLARDKLLMVASDGTKIGVQAIKNGTLDLTVSENAYVNGKTAIRVMYDHLAKKVQPSNPVPIKLIAITRDNMNSLPSDILPPGQLN